MMEFQKMCQQWQTTAKIKSNNYYEYYYKN